MEVTPTRHAMNAIAKSGANLAVVGSIFLFFSSFNSAHGQTRWVLHAGFEMEERFHEETDGGHGWWEPTGRSRPGTKVTPKPKNPVPTEPQEPSRDITLPAPSPPAVPVPQVSEATERFFDDNDGDQKGGGQPETATGVTGPKIGERDDLDEDTRNLIDSSLGKSAKREDWKSPNGDFVAGVIKYALDEIVPKVGGLPPSAIIDVVGAKNDGEATGAIALSLASQILDIAPPTKTAALALTPTVTAPQVDDGVLGADQQNFKDLLNKLLPTPTAPNVTYGTSEVDRQNPKELANKLLSSDMMKGMK